LSSGKEEEIRLNPSQKQEIKGGQTLQLFGVTAASRVIKFYIDVRVILESISTYMIDDVKKNDVSGFMYPSTDIELEYIYRDVWYNGEIINYNEQSTLSLTDGAVMTFIDETKVKFFEDTDIKVTSSVEPQDDYEELIDIKHQINLNNELMYFVEGQV